MGDWTPKLFTITLKREHVGKTATEVSGIVFEDRVGLHRDPLNGAIHVTDIDSGMRIGEPVMDLGEAVRIAERFQK